MSTTSDRCISLQWPSATTTSSGEIIDNITDTLNYTARAILSLFENSSMSYTANNIYPLLVARIAQESRNTDKAELDLAVYDKNFTALPPLESGNSRTFLKNAAHQIEDMLLRYCWSSELMKKVQYFHLNTVQVDDPSLLYGV